MYGDILLPTDGRESTDRLFPHARALGNYADATVHVLYVVDDRSFFALDDDMQTDVVDDLREKGERTTERLARILAAADIDVSESIRRGDPVREIVEYAETEGIDLVVMGTRSGDYSETMVGSTAQHVIQQSSVPVVTVPIKPESREDESSQ